MSSRVLRETERNARASGFLQQYKNELSGIAFVASRIDELAAVVDGFGSYSEAQLSTEAAGRQAYEMAEDAADAVMTILRDIRDIAVTAVDEIEGIEQKFRLPRGSGKRSLVIAARSFAADAEAYRRLFTARGLENDFVEDLREAANTLESALSQRSAHVTNRVGARESKLQMLRQARKIIRDLDPLVRRIFRDNPSRLAAWTHAAHLQRALKQRASPEPVPAVV